MHYGLVVNIQIKSSQNCDRGRIMSDDWTIGGKNLTCILILEEKYMVNLSNASNIGFQL